MQATVTLDEEQVKDAMRFTGIQDESALIREALDSLIQSEVAKRLILLGGTDPDAVVPPRRRFEPA